MVYYICAANIRGDPGLGNVAWKERVDGWKMKQDKNAAPMSTGQATSERGVGDIDASTDVLVDDSLLWVLLHLVIRIYKASFLWVYLLIALCWYQRAILNVTCNSYHYHCYSAFWKLQISSHSVIYRDWYLESLSSLLYFFLFFIIVLNKQIHPIKSCI